MSLADVLQKWGAKPVTPMEVYTDIFRVGDGLIQCKNEPPGDFKANPIAYYKNNDEGHGHFRIMFDDTFAETLQELQQADFAILNGLSYFGRRNVMSHASKLYALIFDIDGVTDSTLGNFLSGAIRAGAYPVPNYIITSGHGIHPYYVFEEPIPLFPNIKLQLKNLKYELTEKLWNGYTSEIKKKQFQGLNQGFRIIGGKTKADAPIQTTQAFLLNTHPFNLEQLNEYVVHPVDTTKLFRETKMTLAQAKKKWPEWYQRVVVDKGPRIKWDIAAKVHGDDPHALYNWWLRNIRKGASYGHRYFCIMCLAIYAAKCDVSFDQLKEDAYALQPFLNNMKPEEPFSNSDIDSALECYDLKYITFPLKDIEKISGIPIHKNKRNGRKQAIHVKYMNMQRNFKVELGECTNGGRPKNSGIKGKAIHEWKEQHPEGTKAECARALGISKPTVLKWWDKELTFAQQFGISKKEALREMNRYYREHGYQEE